MGIDIKKIKDTCKKSQSSSSNTNRSSSTTSSSTRTSSTTSSGGGPSVRDASFYQDNNQMGVTQAYSSVLGSSIFADDDVHCYRKRMEKAISNLQNNESWTISVDDDGDGEFETKKLIDAIADSFDCELDLYIQDKLEKVIEKYGHCSKQYLSDKAIEELRSYGIVVEAIGGDDKMSNRVYAFSLVDENGNILEQDGKKGSIIFGDCLIPDGYAQGAETQLSSILDQMGYDCVSKADFIGRENEYQDVLNQVEANINAGLYNGKGGTDTLYKHRKDILQSVSDLWGGSGSAPGVKSTADIGDGSEVGPNGEILNADGLTKEEATTLENSKDEYNKELKKAINDYKDKHEGKEPTGQELEQIKKDVSNKVNRDKKIKINEEGVAA